jgi:hypothetical protein
MKLSVVLLALSAGGTYAFPGMRNLMVDLMKRQAPPTVPEPLFGDLATKGATTPVGTAILNCINGTAACQNLDPKVNENFMFQRDVNANYSDWCRPIHLLEL